MKLSANCARFRWFWLVAAIGCAVIAMGAAQFVRLSGPTRVSLAQLTRMTTLHFPDGTTLQNSEFHGHGEVRVYAKLQMDHKDLSKFLSSLPKDAEISRSNTLYQFGLPVGPPWWQPASDRPFVAAFADTPRTGYGSYVSQVWILANIGSSGLDTVYLRYSAN